MAEIFSFDACVVAPHIGRMDIDLGTPVRIGARTLRNRVALAPMSRVSATPEGVPTAAMAAYYASFAAGGFGLVITEGTYPEPRAGRAYERQPGIVSEEQARGWRPIVEAVHRHGAMIGMQLMHAGALSQCLASTVAPSAITPRGEKMRAYGGSGPFPMPRALTSREIGAIVESFASSARRAQEVGFDGVELHAANGYLLDQFLTPALNQRDDAYGRDAHGRARIVREIVDAVRTATKPGFVIGVRVSQGKVNDPHHRWADARAVLDAIAASDFDYLHVASEGVAYRVSATLGDGTVLTRLARSITGRPVIANGGMHDLALARSVLREGEADLVSLGRAALICRDWPARMLSGDPVTVRLERGHASVALDEADELARGV